MTIDLAPIRVLVADDEAAARDALADLIADEPDMVLTGAAADADEAAAMAAKSPCDVAVLDVRMPGGGGPAASRAIRALASPPVVIAFSAYEDRASVLEMIRAGAVGYLAKGVPIDEIAAMIRRAAGRRDDAPAKETSGTRSREQPAAAAMTNGSRSVRVIVADDEELVRSAIGDLVESEPELQLVGTAQDADEVLRLASIYRPDVAVVDVAMPGGGGVHAAREMRSVSPGTKVIALSAWRDRETVLEMLRAGATSYLVKGLSSVEDVTAAIHRAAAGQAVLSAEITADVLDELARLSERHGLDLERRRRLEEVLRTRSVSTVFQPICDLASGRVLGAEALARFSGPDRSATAWFQDAEAVGLDEDLELAALQAALAAVSRVPDPQYVSVNLSPTTVSTDSVHDTLRGFPAGRLMVELTEHTAFEDYDTLRAALADLGASGVMVAVDDVGAGSGLRHLLEFTPDVLKLDIALVRGIERDERRRLVVSAFVTLAARAEMTVVAEGIETVEELVALRRLGVAAGQGNYLCAPTADSVPLLVSVPAS